MRKVSSKSTLYLSKFIILLGKPILLLITITITGLLGYIHLIKIFIRQSRRFFILTLTKFPKVISARRDKLVPKKQSIKWLFWSLLITLALISTHYLILSDLPSVSLLSSAQPALTTKIYDRHGELLYQIYKDENRSLIKLTDLPPHLIQATLAAEDKNFYHHFGIDVSGITRAAINNLKCRLYSNTCTLQGGSTITQQLIKNTLLTTEKTLIRKVKELILSIQTERAYSKDQILEMYLNQVGYGGTAYGIEQASNQYFGKSASDLDLAQSAMLAGLPISPTTLSPFGTNPYMGKIRQQQVLESMVHNKQITEDQKVQALSTPLIFNPQGISIKAPHFVMYIRDLLVKELGEEVVTRGGLEVHTTLDLNTQSILQASINSELDKLKNLKVQNGAGLVVNPQTGEVLAMVGSANFFDTVNDGQVNVVLQPRQPGSAIKPLTYALALSNGSTPATKIDDQPICFHMTGQPDYCPKNYDGSFHGQVTLRNALANSYNVPAVKLLNYYGINNLIELAKIMGITTWNDPSRYGLSLTLGGAEITMLDLAGAYSVFANGGTKLPITSILSVKDSSGSVLIKTQELKGTEVISPAVAYQINSILSDKSARAPAFGINSILNLPGENVAVKTGTTNNLRDNWTIGYTSNILVATWVGNNDNSPMSSVVSGITGASPIWANTMVKLLDQDPATPFKIPNNITKANLSCINQRSYEYFIQGTAPILNCAKEIGTITPVSASTSQ